ncbi:protein Star-like [Bacillus rossius redtenbacheri]|uniref:protein Star-like n=1 Tax=Bacillus rossius redtenbacheri TaxID=93214 RepID=UPI002FDD2377
MAVPVSPARRCLQCAAFLAAFTVVMTILLVSTDVRVPRSRKLLNLSEDLDFRNVVQDDPQLISYIQAVHLRYPQGSGTIDGNQSAPRLLPLWTPLVAKLLRYKRGGVFVEAGAYGGGRPSDTQWLERSLGWRGLLVQSNPLDFLALRKHTRPGSSCLLGCLSPMPYPKEVSVRNAWKQVPDSPADHLFSRVKCFPLYSLLLAVNTSSVDYLSLSSDGSELQVLKTIPMDRVNINVIGVQWHETRAEDMLSFMARHQYHLKKKFDQFYIFVHQRVET